MVLQRDAARLRRRSLLAGLASLPVAAALPVRAASSAPTPEAVLHDWYRLVLELVRHTPIYSPPVAARAFGYLGIICHESLVGGAAPLVSLAGQVGGLGALPPAPAACDAASVLNAALAAGVARLFSHTGPTGQRAMQAMARRMDEKLSAATAPDVAAASIAHGQAVVAHVLAWSEGDGGAVIENMGFPHDTVDPASRSPAQWVPTSRIAQQQAPLLPHWGDVRPFTLPSAASCGLPPPPAYSEEPGSAFYLEAKEVHDAKAVLTDEQKLIARFWSDDPMLSPTPPGHWIAIAMQIFERDQTPADRRAEVLARLGMAVSDAFICCWKSKFEYDLVRPVTYIRRVMDPRWEPLLITPPFPEYPSGHSTQSGAAAGVLTDLFGADFAFSDATHEDDGLPVRNFPSFAAAAEEAAISRLYGGIHFRAAIEQGLAQGACVAAAVNRLTTRKDA